MNRKKFNVRRYFLVLLITTMIFVSGMLLGYYLNSQKMNDLDSLQKDLATSSLDNDLQYSLIEEAPCNYVNSTLVIEELYVLSTKLDFMESILGPKNSEVIRLKKYYSLLQIRYWLFMNKINADCHKNINTIIYFYSNEGDCPSCEEQGYILTYIRRKYPNVQVYSFDINLNLNSLDALKMRFNVDKAPFLVINDESFSGFQETAKIIKDINLSNNVSIEENN